ncbi:hypothetical protein PHYPSEUDO_011394 [Phytophthora pseudosyringae]|uniref:Uncharacterized protein n=1 Tax=Phytophthora pseudosyringae TaxID=221518 RepID=A0A8T1VBJ7_9STRA|nr:hypothetical protein PHYPSEUDO_011394 [Phytophthora pseudosyringae]
MCVLMVEGLDNNRGTRVTLDDGFMQPHFKAYSRKLEWLDLFHRDAHVLQVNVWDPKTRTTGRPRFQPGIVYELKKIHAVKFYRDTVQGSMQVSGAVNPGVIGKFPEFETAKRARFDHTDALHDCSCRNFPLYKLSHVLHSDKHIRSRWR